MSVTQGSQTPGQTTLARLPLATGDVQTRRRMSVSPSGDQMDGGGHLHEAGSEPRRGVVVVELGVVGNDVGDEFSSCWSSGELELDATVFAGARG